MSQEDCLKTLAEASDTLIPRHQVKDTSSMYHADQPLLDLAWHVRVVRVYFLDTRLDPRGLGSRFLGLGSKVMA